MIIKGGKKIHHVNEEVVKKWSYDKIEEEFKGKLDYKTLAEKLGIKKTTPKKKAVKSTED